MLGAWLVLALAPLAAVAQEVAELRWLEGEQAVFGINTPDGLDYTTEVLDNGYRLRVSFPEARLSREIRDIGESGIVRGVFPYETDSPNRANFDILLKSAGSLDITPVDGGYRIAVREGAAAGEAVSQASIPAAPAAPATQAAAAEGRDPGAYNGMSDLERSVLQEIESSNRSAEVADSPTPAAPVADPAQAENQQAENQVAEQVAEAARTATAAPADGERARVVLPATNGAADPAPAALADNAPAAGAAPSTSAEPAVELPVQRAAQPAAVPPPPSVTEQQLEQAVIEEMAASQAQVSSAAAPAQPAAPPPPMVESADPAQPQAQAQVEVQAQDAPADPTPAATAAPRLSGITYAELPGGRLQVNFDVDASAEPGVFRTNQPPRIVLDFFDTANGVAETIQRVGFGAVESIVTAQTDDRTRVILNLVAPVDFEQRPAAQGLALVLASPTDRQLATTARTSPAFESATSRDLAYNVENVDFRRTPEGGGKITVKLSSPEIGVDVRDEAGEIVIDFPGTNLPQSLEKRLDVTDFATPVQTVDTFFAGAGARMVVSPVGEYSYSSYQVGDTLTVQVSPILASDDEREPDEFGYVGDRLSFNFQRISVRAALQVIADFTGLNFVTSDSVSGDLSLRLQDVPWDQALDTILQVKGLAKRQRGNVVWVAPSEEIAAKERQALEAQNQVSDLEPLVSELIQINYAKASDIADILKSVRAVDTGYQPSFFGSVSISEVQTESNTLLSERGNVTVDPRTNTLLVQDTREKIREVRKLIAQLDRPVRQVLIETRIVEANDDFSRNIGARLGFTRVTENARFPGVSDSNIGTAIGSATIEDNDLVRAGGTVGDRGGVSVNLPADGVGNANAASYAFTLAKAGSGFSHLIDLEISALEAEGTGKVIANPRLLTTDQSEAHIEQGQERIFTTSVLGEGGVVTKKAVLGLTVTPQITPDDRMVLDVFVTKDSFVAADQATINTKQIRTKVLLDNGETVVIGGIYEQQKSESTTKVPLLGDIPLLGALFRKKNNFDNRTELLIFLTPRILDPTLTVNR